MPPVKTLLREGVFVAFLVAWLASLMTVCLRTNAPMGWTWADGLMLCFAALTTLTALVRQLPWQNVVMVAAIVILVSTGLLLAGNFTGIPFGPLTSTDPLGPGIPGRLPWAFLVVWLVSVLDSYGVAQLLLRPCRASRHYGWWLMGLAGLLVVVLGLAWEPFAVQVQGHWSWPTRASAPDWYSVPWENFVGRFLATLAILFLATPWLIDKRGIEPPPNYRPLILWFLLNLLFTTGSAVRHLWPAVGLSLTLNIFIWRCGPGCRRERRRGEQHPNQPSR